MAAAHPVRDVRSEDGRRAVGQAVHRHGATGVYFKVLTPAHAVPGDRIEVVGRPDDAVTIATLFRALTTERERLPELLPALAYLTEKTAAAVRAATA